MTDITPRDDIPPSLASGRPGDDMTLPVVGWVLALVGWGLVALIIAYVDCNNASPCIRENYRYMIRTVWIGVVYTMVLIAAILVAIGFSQTSLLPPSITTLSFEETKLSLATPAVSLLMSFVVLYPCLAALAIWHLARCIKGIVFIVRGQPITRPGTWFV